MQPCVLPLLPLLLSSIAICHGFQLASSPPPLCRRGGGMTGGIVGLSAPSSFGFSSLSSSNRRRVLIPRSTHDVRRGGSSSSTPRFSPRFAVSDDEYVNRNEAEVGTTTHKVELLPSDKQSIERPLRAAATKASLASSALSFFLSVSIFLVILLSSAFLHPDVAWAVQSGGRMGGSFGSGSSSSSSSSRSSSGSYGRGYSSGGGGGYYSSRPNIIVSPGIGVSPFYNPFYSPFYSPFYAPRPPGVVVVGNGPSFGGIIFFAGFFLIVAMLLSSMGNSVRDTLGGGRSIKFGSENISVLGPGISVVEMSVALQVPDRDSPSSILSALRRLSNTARTDSRVGLQNLTSQVALELLRRKSSIVAASTRGRHYSDRDEGGRAQRAYNDISIRERAKFQRETVSKYGGVDYASDSKSSKLLPSYDSAGKATIAVVTIIMLIDGDSTSKALSSNVNSLGDVEDALSRIAADAKADACLRSAEILWTPEDRSETLSMKEVLADYSSLRSV